MSILANLFGSKTVDGLSLDITKHDVIDMKDSDQFHQIKVDSDLKKTPEVVDRRVMMMYEKKFIEKFKKIGNLHQKCPYCAKAYKTLHLGDKKCTACEKTFHVQKRVQDMGTVAFTAEKKSQFDLQWKSTNKIKKFKFYLQHEYDYIQQQLQKKGKKHLQISDVMHSVLNAYAKNSLNSGHYELYASFMFHKAELMRSEQRFAEALEYYFYVHFLHTNGVDNHASFKVNTVMNTELRERISDLLALGNIQVKKAKDIFDYAIMHLNVFNESSLSTSQHKSYSVLMKEFKLEDALKEEVKPMRSFVLYTNKAS